MTSTNNTLTLSANEETVKDGILSITNMLELIGQKLFPRNIMCSAYSGFFPVGDYGQMFNIFKRSNFQDCRISAYPPLKEGSMMIPNLVLLDIDYDDLQVKNSGIIAANQTNKNKVNRILKRLQEKFSINNFMVVRTGNGRHVLIPFLFDCEFEKIGEFKEIMNFLISKSPRHKNNIMSESFLSFAKKYLSRNQADKANYPNFSNVFLRVPGSINMKMKYGVPQIVDIELEWRYESEDIVNFGDLHPDTPLFYDFMHDMRIVAGRQLYRKQKYGFRAPGSSIYKLIEFVHDTPISDCRKRMLWLVLAPYAVNVRKMSSINAFIWIKQWADKCNKAYPFEPGFNIDKKIDDYIAIAEGNGHYPLNLDRLNTDEWRMKTEGNISVLDFIKSKLPSKTLYDANKGGFQRM